MRVRRKSRNLRGKAEKDERFGGLKRQNALEGQQNWKVGAKIVQNWKENRKNAVCPFSKSIKRGNGQVTFFKRTPVRELRVAQA